jgi:hypothetical protein
MSRDYDRARAGGQLDNDEGQLSGSAERDHSLSGARHAGHTMPDLPGGMTTASHGQVKLGMDVVGSDLDSVGTVKETRDSMFLIDRPLRRDVWAPYSAVQAITANQLVLTCAAGDVNDQGWDSPPMMGGDADDTVATTPTT